jgi:hypothetical protein
MQLRRLAVVLCLLSVSTLSQISGQGSTSTPIRGIKIFSSTFDPSNQTVQLDFMNDSPANITAWGYCVIAANLNNDDPSQGYCTSVDPVSLVVDDLVQERITKQPTNGSSPDGHFIHPGEHKVLSAHFGFPVTQAAIDIDLIVYANGTGEAHGNGDSVLPQIAFNRREELRLAEMMARVGQSILDNQNDQHPTASMINQLQKLIPNEPGLRAYLQLFKKPLWRNGNDAEFIPSDERGHLSKHVLEAQMKATEFAKYQIQTWPTVFRLRVLFDSSGA